MDRTRRQFLLSTALIIGIAGCLQSGSDSTTPLSSSPIHTDTSSSPTAEKDSTGTPSRTELEITAGTSLTTTVGTDKPASPTISSVAPTEDRTTTHTEPKQSTETDSPTETQSETAPYEPSLYKGETIPNCLTLQAGRPHRRAVGSRRRLRPPCCVAAT